ncbi:MAG: phosphoribosylamine--glycine ligase, partial [Spirochaetia bacterium]
MKVMIVGGGGREHALAWKLSLSPKVASIICIPGNGGTAATAKCRNIVVENYGQIVRRAVEEKVDLALIGPEVPLVDGLADLLRTEGISTLGPGKSAAALEGSKIHAKNFMRRHGIRTAESLRITGDEYERGRTYLETAEYPLVIKADGLAGGKGVSICNSQKEADRVLQHLLLEDSLGESGRSILIEQYLEGREASILVLCDGKRALPLVSAMDHKRIGEGDTGPNTGGMGAVAPNPYFTKEYERDFKEAILEPTLQGLREDGYDFRGVLFFGLMLNGGKNYLLEYNVRFGDPETQAVLPLLEDDLAPLLLEAAEGRLVDPRLRFKAGASCNVVLASGGYPGSYSKGFPITIGEEKEAAPFDSGSDGGEEGPLSPQLQKGDIVTFISGAELREGVLRTAGGRVLSVPGTGKDADDARAKAYGLVSRIHFKNSYYR